MHKRKTSFYIDHTVFTKLQDLAEWSRKSKAALLNEILAKALPRLEEKNRPDFWDIEIKTLGGK